MTLVVGLGGSRARSSTSRAALQGALEGRGQLAMLGSEVVRVAELFAQDHSAHRQDECAQAAQAVAAVG
jgi:hypothetical protein